MREAKFWTVFVTGVLAGTFATAVATTVAPKDAHANSGTEVRSMRALESIASSLKKKCK